MGFSRASGRLSLRLAFVTVVGLTFPCALAQETPPEKAAEPKFKPPDILAKRRNGVKEPSANAAIAAGLAWLRRHQAKDGSWYAERFDEACTGGRCEGRAVASADVGVTGLALLAFLGSGATSLEGGDDAPRISRALARLVDQQDSNGCFGPRVVPRFIYHHLVATTALAEASWLTGDPALVEPLTKARDFLLETQNRRSGWRYNYPTDGENDTSVTTYAMVALRTCQFAGLEVPRDAWSGGLAWLEKMTDADSNRVGYQQRGGEDARFWSFERKADPPAPPDKPADPSAPVVRLRSDASMTGAGRFAGMPNSVAAKFPARDARSLTAAAAAAAMLTCDPDAAPLVDRWTACVASDPPSLQHLRYLDLHAALFCALADAQRPLQPEPATAKERKTWRSWREVVVADLVGTQEPAAAGCAAGSWNPSRDPFGAAGGRVYATAMAVLALEAPNRFPRVWSERPKPPKKK